jgi:hypothetical protein
MMFGFMPTLRANLAAGASEPATPGASTPMNLPERGLRRPETSYGSELADVLPVAWEPGPWAPTPAAADKNDPQPASDALSASPARPTSTGLFLT